MASFDSDALLLKQPLATHPTTTSWPNRLKIRLRRGGGRRRLPTVQLGGRKPRRGFFLTRIFRRIRVRWQKLQYSCMLKKLRQYYRSLIKDLIEANNASEAYRQRVLMETSFAVPVVGVSLSANYHARGLTGNHRSIFM